MLHLAEIAYLELATIYDYEKINCLKDQQLRSIPDIAEEILLKVKRYLETEEDK